jgi:hypothetical protein
MDLLGRIALEVNVFIDFPITQLWPLTGLSSLSPNTLTIIPTVHLTMAADLISARV